MSFMQVTIYDKMAAGRDWDSVWQKTEAECRTDTQCGLMSHCLLCNTSPKPQAAPVLSTVVCHFLAVLIPRYRANEREGGLSLDLKKKKEEETHTHARTQAVFSFLSPRKHAQALKSAPRIFLLANACRVQCFITNGERFVVFAHSDVELSHRNSWKVKDYLVKKKQWEEWVANAKSKFKYNRKVH